MTWNRFCCTFKLLGGSFSKNFVAFATTVATSPFPVTLACISIGFCTNLVLGKIFDMVSRQYEKTPVSFSSYCAGNFRDVVCCYCHIHFLISCQSNSNYHGSHELSISKKEPWWGPQRRWKGSCIPFMLLGGAGNRTWTFVATVSTSFFPVPLTLIDLSPKNWLIAGKNLLSGEICTSAKYCSSMYLLLYSDQNKSLTISTYCGSICSGHYGNFCTLRNKFKNLELVFLL